MKMCIQEVRIATTNFALINLKLKSNNYECNYIW